MADDARDKTTRPAPAAPTGESRGGGADRRRYSKPEPRERGQIRPSLLGTPPPPPGPGGPNPPERDPGMEQPPGGPGG